MAKNRDAPIEKKDTSFGLCPIDDPTILPQRGLVLVENLPDVRPGGKPRGKGLPGGGKKYFEGLDESFVREWEDEVGIRPGFVSRLYELEEHVYIVMKLEGSMVNEDGYREGPFIRRIPFKNSERFEPRYNPKTEFVQENIIHLFKVRMSWEGSNLQRFLRERRAELLAQGVSSAELDGGGVFAPLGNQQAKYLRIEEAIEYPMGSVECPAGKIAEIGGIGLVPASMFTPDILKNPAKGFYYNHLRRGVAALPLL